MMFERLHCFIVSSAALRRIGSGSLAAALLIATAGCHVSPQYSRPSVPTPPEYKENQPGNQLAAAGGWKQAAPGDTLPRGKWWEAFQDPELNALEERLTINNQNIKQYFENYMAARAVVRNVRSSLFPTVSISPSVSGSDGGRASSTKSSSSYELPASVSWETDLFGSVRNAVKADSAAAQISAANLANETLSEQASLAEYYFELRGQDAQQQIYDQTIERYKKSLELTRSLFELGIDSQQDVVSAETTLRTAEANAVAVGTTRAQYEHAIALLIGEPAGTFSLPVKALVVVVPAVPTGLPSQLLERRPDIAAAEHTMAEANATVGVAKAAFYPTITLSGSGGTASSALADVVSWPARFWSLGATVSQTLLDFGGRKANVQRYEAQYNADVAAYRQTVLNAFKEVEDYLVSSRRLAEQIEREKLAVDASARYEAIANDRYKSGLDSYLNVLSAQTSLLSNQLTLTQLHTSQMTSTVQLITALGGGWDSSALPSEKDVAKK